MTTRRAGRRLRYLGAGVPAFDLPAIPSGGLTPGRTYRWRLQSFFVSGFDYDDSLDDAFLTDVTDVTDVATSSPRTFSVP